MILKEQCTDLESDIDDSILKLCKLYDRALSFENGYEIDNERMKELSKDIVQIIPSVTKTITSIKNDRKNIWDQIKDNMYNYPYKPSYTMDEYEHAAFVLMHIIDTLSNKDNANDYADIIKSIKVGLHCIIFKNKLENYL